GGGGGGGDRSGDNGRLSLSFAADASFAARDDSQRRDDAPLASSQRGLARDDGEVEDARRAAGERRPRAGGPVDPTRRRGASVEGAFAPSDVLGGLDFSSSDPLRRRETSELPREGEEGAGADGSSASPTTDRSGAAPSSGGGSWSPALGLGLSPIDCRSPPYGHLCRASSLPYHRCGDDSEAAGAERSSSFPVDVANASGGTRLFSSEEGCCRDRYEVPSPPSIEVADDGCVEVVHTPRPARCRAAATTSTAIARSQESHLREEETAVAKASSRHRRTFGSDASSRMNAVRVGVDRCDRGFDALDAGGGGSTTEPPSPEGIEEGRSPRGVRLSRLSKLEELGLGHYARADPGRSPTARYGDCSF
ncbi:hypothetical protein ACHAWF_004254, partial [Thalassiosira exigua]